MPNSGHDDDHKPDDDRLASLDTKLDALLLALTAGQGGLHQGQEAAHHDLAALQRDLTVMRDLLVRVGGDYSVLHARLAAMEDSLAKLYQAVFTGNGQQSMLSRLLLIEDERHGDRVTLNVLGAKIETIAKDAEAMRYGGSVALQEMARKFDQYIGDQAQVQRNTWWAMTGLVVTILLGVLSTAATLYVH